MTINRRWLAHEWLYLLGGLAFAFLVLLFSGFLFGPVLYSTRWPTDRRRGFVSTGAYHDLGLAHIAGAKIGRD